MQFYYISDFKKTYTITDLNENIPSEMAMVSQNQPNPFANETTINVTLAKKTPLTLQVYNLTGQKVMDKNYGVLDQGVHAIGKKIVEEAAEVWMASEFQSKEEAAEEMSQLIYHVQTMMIAIGLTIDDIYRYL